MADFIDKHGHVWTESERSASLRKTKAAIDEGKLLHPEVLGCNRCKQKQGLIDYHNHNYETPDTHLEPLCYRCHLVLHAERKCPKEVEEYFDGVAQGNQWPPLFTRNLSVLWRDHGISYHANRANWKKSTKITSVPINRYLPEFQNYVWPESDSDSETNP